jgi:Ca2+:H+ antiporter
MAILTRNQRFTIIGAVAITVLAGVLSSVGASAVLVFVISGVALGILASLVGLATEELGSRLGPAATGVLQSGLGNLPELFVGYFSLKAGLIAVVQAALIGSILANSLLVLGLAFLVGGLKNGTQRFRSEQPRTIATLMLLAVAALLVPTLANKLHTPADPHSDALSLACALILLVVFVASIPVSLSSDPATAGAPAEGQHNLWPLWLAAGVLAIAGIGAALVSDWFVEALRPAIKSIGLSEAFTGLVVVAIAGNAVENVVGIQLAAANKSDYAISVIQNSSLQVALGLTPVLVLLSFFVGSTHLTLVLPPLLVVALTVAALVSTFIIYDGESIWLEGLALIGLYSIIAASFWWG